jgi:uncharacterized protein YeaO (DUF488 family)
MLKTKSFLKRKSFSDGIRIAVMRRIKPEYKFDIWLPVVSPSEKLLKQYVINKEITWEDFKPKFRRELSKKRYFLNLIGEMAKTKNVTLLCFEEDHSYCHRSIITEMIQELYPNLKVKHC